MLDVSKVSLLNSNCSWHKPLNDCIQCSFNRKLLNSGKPLSFKKNFYSGSNKILPYYLTDYKTDRVSLLNANIQLRDPSTNTIVKSLLCARLESMYVTPDISGVEIKILGAAAQPLGAKVEILRVLAQPLALRKGVAHKDENS